MEREGTMKEEGDDRQSRGSPEVLGGVVESKGTTFIFPLFLRVTPRVTLTSNLFTIVVPEVVL